MALVYGSSQKKQRHIISILSNRLVPFYVQHAQSCINRPMYILHAAYMGNRVIYSEMPIETVSYKNYLGEKGKFRQGRIKQWKPKWTVLKN
jgi:hypothetical protein